MRARNRGLYYVSSCALSSRASSTTVATKDGDTDIVCLQVETHAANARREFHSSACMFLRPQTRPIPSPTLKTRPISSTLPPTEVPATRDCNIEETSDTTGLAVAYERAARVALLFGRAAKAALMMTIRRLTNGAEQCWGWVHLHWRALMVHVTD